MLELRAGYAYVHELGAERFKLGLRLRHVHVGCHAALETPLGEVELVFEVGDGALEQSDLRVETAELEVVGGEFGVQQEIDVGEVRGGGLGRLARGFHAAPDAAPEVGL